MVTLRIAILLACLVPAGCVLHAGHPHHPCCAHAACAAEAEDDGDEREVALADVPHVVLEAAARAFPHVTWTGAEVEVEDGREVWELSGMQDGEPVELELTADGTVLEFERG